MRDHCCKTASRRTCVDDDEKTAIDHDVEQNGSERDQEGKWSHQQLMGQPHIMANPKEKMKVADLATRM